MNLLRRIASLPILRTFLLQPTVRRHVAAVLALRFLTCAALTTTPLTFVVNDLLRARNQVRQYRLRRGGDLVLKHRRDTEAFHEIYLGGEYEPPPELRARIGSPKRILDVGGNIGMFANWAHRRWSGAEIVSFEPAAENTEVFRNWLGDRSLPITLVEACAMTKAGRAFHTAGSGAGSHFEEGGGVGQGVPAVDLFDFFPADFVKMDIEGGEWPILSDPRMAELHDVTIVMEYHRAGAPSVPALDAARGLLERAGFSVGYATPNFWGHGTLWAWRD